MTKKITLIIMAIILVANAQAKLGMALVKNENKIGKWYFASMVDANTFSWAFIKGSGVSNLRYTAFVNTGIHANYNLKKNLAIYTGLEFRNMGYANIIANKRFRYSTTYFGMPLGFRLGDLKNKTEFIAGTGFDLPMYYKEKSWDVGDKKNTKIKARVSTKNILRGFNPYLFAGYKYNGLGIKLQYYPTTFYTPSLGQPNTNIMYASLILDIKSGSKSAPKKVADSE